MRRLIAAVLLAAPIAIPIAAPPALAKTIILVPQDQSTIQAAIQAAANGDEVLVSPGTYTENINFDGKAITVESVAGPSRTIIDGGGLDSVVTFDSNEPQSAVLKGFTIRNGLAGPNGNGDGGGIQILNASPTIEDNVITNNLAYEDGAGIFVNYGVPIITHNVISHNSEAPGTEADFGGGISVGNASGAVISHNTIEFNTEDQFSDGGGIELWSSGTVTIMDNMIMDNSASYSGGIGVVNDSDASIIQNLFVGNSGSQGSDISIDVPIEDSGPLLVNNTVVASDSGSPAVYLSGYDQQMQMFNTLVSESAGTNAIYCDGTPQPQPPPLAYTNAYSAGGTAYGGTCASDPGTHGNISANPLLTKKYKLSPKSPSINAGTNAAPQLPSKDLAGKPRIVGGIVDQGAYEYQGG